MVMDLRNLFQVYGNLLVKQSSDSRGENDTKVATAEFMYMIAEGELEVVSKRLL